MNVLPWKLILSSYACEDSLHRDSGSRTHGFKDDSLGELGFYQGGDPSLKCTVNHPSCLLHSSALGPETRVSCDCRGYTIWEAAEKPSPQPSKMVPQTRLSRFTLFPHCPSIPNLQDALELQQIHKQSQQRKVVLNPDLLVPKVKS